MRTVYLLWLVEPYQDHHPTPIEAVIVAADALRHPDVPQPDGVLMYRCLTEAPGRRDGELVPLSTLAHELNGGRLWSEVGDWEAVADALLRLVRAEKIDAMPVGGLGDLDLAVLASGPVTEVVGFDPATGEQIPVRGSARGEIIEHLAGYVNKVDPPLNAGNPSRLVDVPTSPKRMPYEPYRPPTGQGSSRR